MQKNLDDELPVRARLRNTEGVHLLTTLPNMELDEALIFRRDSQKNGGHYDIKHYFHSLTSQVINEKTRSKISLQNSDQHSMQEIIGTSHDH